MCVLTANNYPLKLELFAKCHIRFSSTLSYCIQYLFLGYTITIVSSVFFYGKCGERGDVDNGEGGGVEEENSERGRTESNRCERGRLFQLVEANSDSEFILSISARWSGKEFGSVRRSLY